jgi:hypothetical protein
VKGRDPVLAEWGWELEEPAPAVSVRAVSALASEALSWRAHYPRQPVVLLRYDHVLSVSRPVTRLTVSESVGRRCAQLARIGNGPRAWSTSGPRNTGLLDANYRRMPGRNELGR